jgi:hypothetical protein
MSTRIVYYSSPGLGLAALRKVQQANLSKKTQCKRK